MRSAKNASRKKISLERYMEFILSHPRIVLPVPDLNQIVSLHGFRKVTEHPKKNLTQALKELDLMDLSRSTIHHGSGIFPSASITLEDLVDDLDKLNWQECRVTSVQTFHSSKGGSASTGPADSRPQSVSIVPASTLNSNGDFPARLSATGVAESKKQSAVAAKSSGCLGAASKSPTASEISRPAESEVQSAAAATRKRKSLDEMLRRLPAHHLSTAPAAESKKKQTSAARKRTL
ncbi:unnamed protein product [Linum trigynum]|uniref:DUF7787 domain-containing protein n=1 Tax=Linum trigynum TaxID=586398 RepID=A0AAV2F7W3_9ROSI